MSVKDVAKKYEQAKKTFEKEITTALVDELKEIFDANEDLNTVSWTQGTPSWNDGDTCYFGVQSYSESIHLNGESEDDESDVDCLGQPQEKRWAKIRDKVAKIIDEVPLDIMESAYGQGRVTIDRRGNSDTDPSGYCDY